MAKLIVGAAVAVAVAALSFASTQIQASSDKDVASSVIAQSITAKYPNTKIDEIKETPMAGVYEVVMGKNIAYTNAEGRYFLFGHLFDMQTQTDMTAENKKRYSKIQWESLDFDNALVFKQGSGERKIAMITDIDCGYCRMLEYELSKLDNVTIYKFLTPIQGGYSQSVSIWCAADRNKAYLERILAGKPAAERTCANEIEQNLQWFRDSQLTGTPTLIKQDGEVLQGYTTADEIEEWLK